MTSIGRLSMMDTVTCPPLYLAVVHLTGGDGTISVDEASARLSSARDSLDAVAFRSDDDILGLDSPYRLMSALRPKGMKAMIVTAGTSASALDDIMGGGYADMAVVIIRGRMDAEQERTLSMLNDYGHWYAVSVEMVPGITGEDDMKAIARTSSGCRRFLIRAVDPAKNGIKGAEPFGEKDIRSLTKSVNGLVKNPTFLGFI